MATYVVRVWVIESKPDTYVVEGECVDLLEHGPPQRVRTTPCEPCSLHEAQAPSYEFAAKLTRDLHARGHEVASVNVYAFPTR